MGKDDDDVNEKWTDADFLSFGGVADDDDEDGKSDGTPASEDIFGDSAKQIRQPQEQIQQQRRQRLPPWMDRPTDYRRTNPLTALHNEIVSFCNLMQPLPEEIKKRAALVERIEQMVQQTFGQGPNQKCKMEVFGSQATGMFLPTSDIDLVIILNDDKKKDQQKKELSTGDEAVANKDAINQLDRQRQRQEDEKEMADYNPLFESPLQRLAEAIAEEFDQEKELTYLEVIENTTVPLVKFTHGPTNTSIDVCFDREEGVRAASLIKTYLHAMPPLRPLTFVLKYFLAARGLNEPYTGGVGSYMLQLMIVSFLQARERATTEQHRGHPNLYNLGALLVEFFELYGLDFNYITTGISVRHDGYYFPKGDKNRQEQFWQSLRPFALAMENPLEPTLDVGRPSFRMQTVQRSFEVAFKVLLTHVANPVVPTESILASILPPTDEMSHRAATAAAAAAKIPSINTKKISPPRRYDSRDKATRAESYSARSSNSSGMDTGSSDDGRSKRRRRY